MINDILDVSKIDAGHLHIESTDCSPDEIITDVIDVLRVKADENKLSLSARWSSRIPSLIRTDPARLRQLLIKLVGNAIKFTDRGSVEVVAALDQTSDCLVIQVVDTGVGISADRLAIIFEPFEQADSSITRKFGGTGLGLAISHRLAERLGGNLSVTSQVGAGSTFSTTIDAGRLDALTWSEPPLETTAPQPRQPAAKYEVPDNTRVLLVEDSRENQHLIKAVLAKAGAKVTLAGTARPASKGPAKLSSTSS